MLTALLLLVWFFQPLQTYSITGTAVNAFDGKPVANARVFLVGGRLSPAPVKTGVDGHFQFNNLSAGKYYLYGEHLGHVRQIYGQRALYQPGSLVAVGPLEMTDDIIFPFIPNGVLYGYVTDARGEPVPGLVVTVSRIVGSATHRRVAQVFTGATDDQGYYRVWELPKGFFAVSVSPSIARGTEVAAVEPMGYPMTYFPGTSDASEAETVEVSPGRETRADIKIQPVLAARIVAKAPVGFNVDGLSAYVSAPSLFGQEQIVSNGLAPRGGQFQIENVPQGQYILNVVRAGTGLFSRQVIEAAPPVTEVTLANVRAPPVTISVEAVGRIQSLGQTPVVILKSLSNGESLRQPLQLNRAMFQGVRPGQYTVSVWITPAVQMPLVSVALNGVEQPSQVVRVSGSGDVALDLVVDGSAMPVMGRVVRNGVAQGGVIVILIKKTGWEETGAFRVDQSSTDGSFTWSVVAPGEYLMFASEDGEPVDYDDPDRIRNILSSAQALTLTGDPLQQVTLQMAQPPGRGK